MLHRSQGMIHWYSEKESIIFPFHTVKQRTGLEICPTNRHSNGEHFQESMDQLDMVANPARGQLNRENDNVPVPFVPQNLVSRDNFGRPVQLQSPHSSHPGRLNRENNYGRK